MVRAPCCEKKGLNKGAWTSEEDRILISYIQEHGHGNWRALPKLAGLLRCGKSCRLRWINYLRPDIKRGNFTPEEEDTIIQLHETLGNRWSAIAAKLPGRTDNEIKNVWHTHLKKRLEQNETSSKRKSKPKKKSRISKSASTNQQSEAPVSHSMTPKPTSSEMSSVTESSIPIGENNNTDFSMETVPMIDESFWTDPMSSVSSGESSDFNGDIIQRQFSFTDSSVDHINSGDLLWDDGDNQGLSMDDEMDFWYDLFVRAGGVQDLPDF